MEEIFTSGIPKVKVSDIIGLWEVIRIEKGGEIIIYPWIQGRFLFNFLENEIFVCIKEGVHSNGLWKLADRDYKSRRCNLLLLNDTFPYEILEIDEDEMILNDCGIKYLMTRKF